MYRADDVIRIKEKFGQHKIEYMFIGKGAAIIQGYSDTTQDIDVYPRKDPENNKRLVEALKDLEFEINSELKEDLLRGKDFIQFRTPFDLDIVFAPDGFDSYDEAKQRYMIDHEGYPVLSISGIIHNKQATGRVKDRESLWRLKSFEEYLHGKQKPT